MSEPLTGYEATSVADVESFLNDNPAASSDEVYLGTVGHSERAIAAVAAKRAGSGGGGGSLPTSWTDGGHGDVGVTVDDPTKTALTLIADGDQSAPILRVLDENGDEILALGGDPFAVGRQGPITITARGGSAGNIPLNVLNEDGNNVFSVDADGVTQLTGHADPADTSAATFSIVKPPLAHPFTKLLEIATASGDKLFQVDAEGHLISGAITDPSDNLGPSQFSIFLDPTPGATKLHFVALDSGGTPRSAVINLT